MDSGIFGSLVRKSFNFLISEYGFSVVKEDGFQVRFENDDVFLTVHYDANRSYELDVEIGQLKVLFNGEERPFNLGEVLRTERAAEGRGYRALQASDSDALESCITKLAALVSLNAKDYLLDNKFSFKRLSNLREEECNQYELKMKLEGVRREAQMAWQDKDYAKVVSLYKPVESIITEAEKKKLSFAEKHS
ncbi:hypothetical protein [Marinomonas sp. THO17]|uniref:hypothetical protein n=1 Tax=Marinomonas sp. THO17 TaxID=3149048 RepID=UPI00336C2A1B